jgi:hypothetical protein
MTGEIFLELFSGTKTMSNTAKEFGFEVFNIDIDESLSPSLCADILTLSAEDIIEHCGGRPHTVWASPDCTKWSYANGSGCEFTQARRHEPLSPDALHAIELIDHTLALIADLRPKYWFMENPFHGALKEQIVVANYPFVDVYYCAYEWPYQKRTRIWGAFPPKWNARTVCTHTKHDNIKGYGNARKRAEIPVLLSREICASLIIASIGGNPQRPTLEDY